MASFKNIPMYLWDFYFLFYDLLDYMEFSERNLDWQRRSHALSLERKAKLKNYSRDEYDADLYNIEHRFEVSLARNIRYSAVIALATSIEWIAKFLEKRFSNKLPKPPEGTNKSIHILQQLYELADCNLNHNLKTLEKIIKIRNCIAHASGSVENYQYGDEVAAIVIKLKGFGISDKHFLERVIDVDKGAIEAVIKETKSWIIDFVKECEQKNLIIVK